MMLLIIERLFFLSFFNGMDEGEMMKVLAKKNNRGSPAGRPSDRAAASSRWRS